MIPLVDAPGGILAVVFGFKPTPCPLTAYSGWVSFVAGMYTDYAFHVGIPVKLVVKVVVVFSLEEYDPELTLLLLIPVPTIPGLLDKLLVS